ncbi:MAG: hypothetical protein DHS20C14_02730 [Phycisphaeraceae bacterium]|nr:MAG: hypothetical protein DHS20C14_02730 [Phycisphaeraceae bacterium]
MKTSNVTALAALTAFGIASTASANILQNGGFEAGAGADAADWAEIIGGPSGSTERSTTMPNSGNASAYMWFDHIANPAAGGAYFIEQNQGANVVLDTESYDLSFFAKVDSTDFTGTDMFVQILWLDQDGSDGGGVKGEMLTSLVGLGINTSYQQFTMNGLDVAAGADSFILRFQVSAGAVDNVANGMYVDDASLALVPTPASAAVLGLGGLVAMRRRR